MRQWTRGDKVEFAVSNKAKVPAIVIESGIAVHGRGYNLVRLKIATWSELHRRWLPSIFPSPVSRSELLLRHRDIPGLDPDYKARDAAMQAQAAEG
jgi:hypothetical protein